MLEVERSGRYRTIAWYTDLGGKAHGRDYYLGLDDRARAKFLAPMRYIADQPIYRNKEKYRHESDGIHSIKVFKHRLMCFQDGNTVIITHGFEKKSDKTPRGEHARACRLRDEYHMRKD